MCVRPGLVAPDFKTQAYFPNGEIKDISLSDYKGKWVLLFFYPADFTFVCPTELVDVAKYKDELEKLNVQVMAISIDTVFVHKVWQEVELSKLIPGGFTYPMASDVGGKIGTLYGVYDENAGVNLRGTFLIDPDGVLQFSIINYLPIGRNMDEIVRLIQACQEVELSKLIPGGFTYPMASDVGGKIGGPSSATGASASLRGFPVGRPLSLWRLAARGGR
jgi:peroxiredoxin (alkyl hydroperoxide reductase subunit C)